MQITENITDDDIIECSEIIANLNEEQIKKLNEIIVHECGMKLIPTIKNRR